MKLRWNTVHLNGSGVAPWEMFLLATPNVRVVTTKANARRFNQWTERMRRLQQETAVTRFMNLHMGRRSDGPGLIRELSWEPQSRPFNDRPPDAFDTLHRLEEQLAEGRYDRFATLRHEDVDLPMRSVDWLEDGELWVVNHERP